ncbi:MAG: bifunctional protein-serine/threonine kinase/phosphatase [Nitrospirae bacterium]|nr:bifunctional protein-serine/threonine kinase/phosphatase [Nitrospirota bacterium]
MVDATHKTAVLQVEIGQGSVIGRRERNEDFYGCILPQDATLRKRKGILLAIADGLGGHEEGMRASQIAVKMVLEDYYGTPESWSTKRSLAQVIQAANRWIHEDGKRTGAVRPMATTLSVLCLRGVRYTLAHVGDSRAYLYRQGKLQQLTADHCWHGSPTSIGGHGLTRAIGMEPEVRLDIQEGGIQEGDLFLLCTDGVSRVLDSGDLDRFLDGAESPQQACDRILRAVGDRGGEDNATIQAITVRELPDPLLEELRAEGKDLPVLVSVKPGMIIDGYRIMARIHKGGMGTLYRALDLETGKEVVLKFPHPLNADDPVYRERFLREAWAAKQVRSPWSVMVLDRPDRQRTALYTVWEYLEGKSLRAYLQSEKRMTVLEAIDMARQVCHGLIHLHRKEIRHRDLKPDNLFLLEDGGVKILDFGVARVEGLPPVGGWLKLHREVEGERTEFEGEARAAPGTTNYMAPELFQGERGDARSDLFALGVTLYEALTGRLPYGDLFQQARPAFKEPVPPSRHNPGIGPELEAVVLKAVARDPAKRYQEASALLYDLEHLDRVSPAQAEPLLGRGPAVYWRAAFIFMSAVAALLAALLFLGRGS